MYANSFCKRRNVNIKRVNKNNTSAIIRSEGVRDVELYTRDGQIFNQNNLIYAKALFQNFLSLGKFVDEGLEMYLDHERIASFNPVSKEMFVSGIYEKPCWVIEFQLYSSREENKNKIACSN